MDILIVSAIARLGRNAPMVEALARATKLEELHEKETKELNQQIRMLQDQVRDLQVEAKRAALARSTIAPCSLEAMAHCFEGMGIESTYGVRLENAIRACGRSGAWDYRTHPSRVNFVGEGASW